MDFKLKNLIEILDDEYNFDIQENWDNSGFQIGDFESKVNKILLTMDITVNSIEYAIENGINCIISHHPLFFEKIINLDKNSSTYKKLKLIIDNDTSVISVHTPLDLHKNGINKALADSCMLSNQKKFVDYSKDLSYGFVGNVESQTVTDYIKNIKLKNNFENIIFYGSDKKTISKVAVFGGSGAFSIKKAIDLNVDLLISSDFKYHDVQYALENSINLIDLGHYESEVLGLNNLKEFLSEKLNKEIEIYIYKNNIFKRNLF